MLNQTGVRAGVLVGMFVGGLAGLAGVLGGCSAVEETDRGVVAKRYAGFGNYTREITTDSAAAQEWFDQGIQLMYGFNHDEAIRSFEMAAEVDPSAAMAWWGIAYCQGININDPEMTEERSKAGRRAVDKAMAELDDESAVERALVGALDERYEWPAPEDRSGLDRAYAGAMEEVYARFSDDGDVGALYSESLMNLQPWDYWENDGTPKGRITEVVKVLERVMRAHPEHPGAKHFYIHAVEASSNPDRAVAAAEELIDMVPGSGHLVHMPSHIFIRVGRYEDAAESNMAAIEADRAYFRDAPEPGLYAMYYGHNVHFLAFASMMSGNYERAIGAARDLEVEIPEAALRGYAGLIDGIMPSSLHVMIRFGKWEEILEEPDYPEYRLMSRATWSYARSVACSALGRTTQARREMAEFERRIGLVPEEWYVMQNPVGNILPIARAMVKGELLYREGKKEEAFAILREGIVVEDQLIYDEPPGWMLPVRHALGALLVESGEFVEAEKLYREDLEFNRGNGWALVGLREALVGQGKMGEAMKLDDRISAAFADADTVVESSCFCAP
ncbi:MAG: hypothetical protein ACSHX5_08560 [Phycisphaerales bacterium]